MQLKLRLLASAGALAAAIFATAPLANAQEASSEAPDRPRREYGGNPEQRINRLKEALQLTDAQVASLREIFVAEVEAARAAREKLGADATREQRMASRRELTEQSNAKVEAVLTEEQRVKWAELRERMQRGGPGGQRPQGAPAPAQP